MTFKIKKKREKGQTFDMFDFPKSFESKKKKRKKKSNWIGKD